MGDRMDARMKKWSGGTRVVTVKAIGSGAKPKRLEFNGDRGQIGL
jgi:hypothetical protein